MKVTLCAVLLAALALTAIASPSDVFSAKDSKRLESFLLSKQQSNGLFGSLQDTFYAVSTLSFLGVAVPNKQSICSQLSSSLSSSKDVADISSIVQASSVLKCPITLPTQVKQSLESALNSESLSTLASASDAIISLSNAKLLNIADFDFSSALQNALDLQEEDGSFRSSSESDDASAYNAGIALQLVSSLVSNVPALKNKQRSAIKLLTAKIDALLDNSGPQDSAVDVTAGSSVSYVKATTAVLTGLLAVASETSSVSNKQLDRFASALVDNRYVSSIEDSYYLIQGLQLLTTNQQYIPLVVRITQSTPTLKLRVTNVLDKFAAKTSVTISQVTSKDSNRVIARDIQVTMKKEEGSATVDSLKSVDAGYYELSINVNVDNKNNDIIKSVNGVKRTVKVTTEVNSIDVTFTIAESTKATDSDVSQKVSYPKEITTKLSADSSKQLHLKAIISAKIKPHQVFFQLSRQGGKSAVFAAKATDSTYIAKLNLGSTEVLESLNGSGEYQISLIVGDALLTKSIEYKFSSITLTLSDVQTTPSSTHAAAAAAAASLEYRYEPKAEIQHSFRGSDARASSFLALIFSVLSVLPFLGLLVALFTSSNVKLSLPSCPSEFFWAMIFQGSLLSILLLYTCYWLHLNIFQASASLVIISPVALFAGSQALRLLHSRSTATKAHSE